MASKMLSHPRVPSTSCNSMWEWCNGPSGTRWRFQWLMDSFPGHSIHRAMIEIMSVSLLPHVHSVSHHVDIETTMDFFFLRMTTSDIWTFRFITVLDAESKCFALHRGQSHWITILLPEELEFPFHFQTTLKGLSWYGDEKGFKVMVWARIEVGTWALHTLTHCYKPSFIKQHLNYLHTQKFSSISALKMQNTHVTDFADSC